MAQFITFEGVDGSGKSTQARMLYEYFDKIGRTVDLTREIGGTPVCEAMRNVILNYELSPVSELFQIMAARYDHMHRRILPNLNAEKDVICDRFIDSTVAYQGQFLENGMDLIYDLHTKLISTKLPDVTFFLDINPEVGIKRAYGRGQANRFEEKNLQFHTHVRTVFLAIAEKFPKRVKKISVNDISPEKIHTLIKLELGL